MKQFCIFACALLVAYAPVFAFESDEESFEQSSVQFPNEVIAFKIMTNNYTDEKQAIAHIEHNAELVDMLVQAEEHDKDLQRFLSKLVLKKGGASIITMRHFQEKKKRGLLPKTPPSVMPSQSIPAVPLSATRAPSGTIQSPVPQQKQAPIEIMTFKQQTNNYSDDEIAHALLMSDDQLFDTIINFAATDAQLEQLLERLAQTDDIVAERLTTMRSIMPSQNRVSPRISPKPSAQQSQLSREEIRRQQDAAYEEALKADQEKERMRAEQAHIQTEQGPEKKQRIDEEIRIQPTPSAEPAPAALTPQQLRELRAKRFGGN